MRVKLIAAFAAVYLFWGGTFLAIRYAVAEVPPLLTIAIRCAGGALILFAWLAVRGQLERTTAAQWRVAFLAGALLFIGCHSVMAWAEQRVPSGQTALLMTMITPWLVLLNAFRERRLPAARVLVGLGLGVLGVAVLTHGTGSGSGTLIDRLALVVSDLFWAAGSLVARHGARPESAAQSTAMQLAAGAVAVLSASAAAGELSGWTPFQVTPRAVAALVFLVVCGTVLGFGAYTWLLRVTTPAAVGTYAFVNPVVALLLASLVGDDKLSGRALIAAALVIGAVVLTRDQPRGEKR
ncbi:MAG TPA: EamA family transporter [Thermoanaerobaculia bacterium]|nr:EamA family transporter [Thermoanaerobaculia bacterium]